MSRSFTYAQAILEATEQCMAEDKNVYLMGLGATDPRGVFGTTLGLEEKFGSKRVFDIPTSENAITGVAVGTSLKGMRPILTHQRVDFCLLSLDQIINNAAKWHYMFGGKKSVPLVIRLIIGRGWGQGPQHSQVLSSIFAHIPGLKVVAPASAADAKGLLIAAIRDDNPVIFMEHRWLHNTFGPVSEASEEVPIGKAKIVHTGKDVTVVATSHMVIEAMRAADVLEKQGISAEIIDLRTIRPIDTESIVASVSKTGHLIVADDDWATCGVSAEILALCSERIHAKIKRNPVRVTPPDFPSPTSLSLSEHYYPRAISIVNLARAQFDLDPVTEEAVGLLSEKMHDVADSSFLGPF